MSVPPIDSPVASFEVRCRVGQFVMDSDDPDRAPDLVPVGGTVTIEPDLRRPIRVQGETGPRVVGVDPLEFTIDPTTGKLIHPDGEPGVELIDPTDPHLDPQGWTYTATVRPEKGRSWTVTFGAPEDGDVVDLGSVVSVAPSPGVTENYLQQTVAARDAAESFAVRAETAATEAEDYAPSFDWDGTRLVIDGDEGPDLQGPPSPSGVPDTGWRDVSDDLDAGYLALNPNAGLQMRRYGDRVYINLRQGTSATADGAFAPVYRMPTGFRCHAATRTWGATSLEENTGRPVRDDGTIYLGGASVLSTYAVPGKRYAYSIEYFTPDDWPTTLPGAAL